MSQENVEVVRRGIDAFNAFMRGELSSQAYAQTFDPQIEMVWPDRRTYPDFPQRLDGVSEVIAFSEQYRDEWVDLTQEPVDLIQAPGDRVLALIRQSASGRQSGVPIVIHFFEVVTFRDGRICRVAYFRHRADAERAAGLSE